MFKIEFKITLKDFLQILVNFFRLIGFDMHLFAKTSVKTKKYTWHTNYFFDFLGITHQDTHRSTLWRYLFDIIEGEGIKGIAVSVGEDGKLDSLYYIVACLRRWFLIDFSCKSLNFEDSRGEFFIRRGWIVHLRRCILRFGLKNPWISRWFLNI